MEKGRYEEDYERGLKLGQALGQERLVDVAQAKVMHWYVPVLPENSYIFGIPPISIKFSISKFEQFGQYIQVRVEKTVES